MIKGLLTEGKTKMILVVDPAQPDSSYAVESRWKTDKDGKRKLISIKRIRMKP